MFFTSPVNLNKGISALRAPILAMLSLMWFATVSAQDVQPPATEEIIITGRVSGPPLWQVKNGDNSLWIFGFLSPLPDDLDFDASSLEPVIAGADEVLAMPDLEVSESLGPFRLIGLYRQYRRMRVNADKQTLEDILPADLYARVRAARDAYRRGDKDIFRLRPFFAAIALDRAARKRAGLEDAGFVGKRIARLIKRHKVPRKELIVETSLGYREMLDEITAIPPAAELTCLSLTLERIESDIDGMKNRAQAWAYGYLSELYAMEFPDQQGACGAAVLKGAKMRALSHQFDQLWLTNAQRALTENHSTFAMLDMHTILARDGLLTQLEDKGYEVVAP